MWPPTTLHVGPGLARTPDGPIVEPFMSQTATLPSLFCSTRSVLPSLLKSPVPSTCHAEPGLAITPDRLLGRVNAAMRWLVWGTMPLGTLADALVYPGRGPRPDRDAMVAALNAVGLPHLADDLGEDSNWAQRLSGGEQQRLGFARVLLLRPAIVFLDEATSAVDEASESALYRLLREADWHPTIVSVGHHGALKRFHGSVVDLGAGRMPAGNLPEGKMSEVVAK